MSPSVPGIFTPPLLKEPPPPPVEEEAPLAISDSAEPANATTPDPGLAVAAEAEAEAEAAGGTAGDGGDGVPTEVAPDDAPKVDATDAVEPKAPAGTDGTDGGGGGGALVAAVAPPPNGSVQMSDEVKKDLVPSLHRLLASLTEIVHSEDNRTVLYVPSYFSGESAGEGEGPEAEAEIIAEMANDSAQVRAPRKLLSTRVTRSA